MQAVLNMQEPHLNEEFFWNRRGEDQAVHPSIRFCVGPRATVNPDSPRNSHKPSALCVIPSCKRYDIQAIQLLRKLLQNVPSQDTLDINAKEITRSPYP
jgi:hypothetical protein